MQQQTMNPWDEIPRRVRPSFALRSKRVNVISPSFRELHRGQRSCAAPKGRTYDRTVPEVKSTEKLLHRRAVPHMGSGLTGMEPARQPVHHASLVQKPQPGRRIFRHLCTQAAAHPAQSGTEAYPSTFVTRWPCPSGDPHPYCPAPFQCYLIGLANTRIDPDLPETGVSDPAFDPIVCR